VKALIADDDATARRMVRAALATIDVEVVEVSDGDAAWEALSRDDAPQIALLDWQMPGADGLELCRRLRARPGERPYVYAAIVSSRISPADILAGFEAGADDFVTKPFDISQLAARVRAAHRLVGVQTERERSRSYLSSVLEHLDHGVMLVDADDSIVYANPALAEVFDTPLAATIGTRRADYLRAHAGRFDDPDRFLRAVEVDRAGPDQSADFEISRPRRQVLRWMGSPVSLPDGLGQLDMYQDVTREIDQQRAQEHLARTDPLTGLANRRGFAEAAEREMSRASRTGAALGAVIFDIDHFKRVNDLHGHGVGDRVLQQVARCVAVTARCTDVVARWGGEELIALLPDTDIRGARRFADRVRQAVAAGHEDLPAVTISAGVAQRFPSETIEDAVARADARLYLAKASGRDTVK